MRPTSNLLLGCLLIVFVTQVILADENNSPPPTPVFATNYHVRGVLSLPYAELNEPFNAWYDKDSRRSRTDYYGNLYKIYQFGPQAKSGNSQQATSDSVDKNNYGALYKLVYVPEGFEPNSNTKAKESLLGRLHDALSFSRLHNNDKKNAAITQTKRVCFEVQGDVGATVEPQTALPNLADFTYDSTGHCPHNNYEHRNAKCELWKLVTNIGDKKNTYKMWVRRNSGNDSSNQVTPVTYYMLGYDSLLGSHYDRYDINYYNFRPNEAADEDFYFDVDGNKCGSMPGPGADSSAASVRSHMVVQNPIHEYVVEPHRYDHIDHEFDKFAKQHEKKYENPEHQRRSWHNFMHNFRFINGKNRELKTYKLGVNRFADNNMHELSYLRGRFQSKGYNGGLDYERHHKLKTANSAESLRKLPDSWDWQIRGAVTPVKDQAVCGSCWSFGTSGTVEGAYFVKTGKLPKLSQQQMVDCSWKYGNNGCDGGEDFRAYQYIMQAGGLATEEDYGHYLGVDGKCHDNDVKKTVKISGFYNVTANDPEALKHALYTYGPVTVAIDASRPTFTFYSHGVYYDEKCNRSPDGLDHQVLVVGYAVVDGKFVWLVKNSWSTYWGNNGYILMSAENNNCGLMDVPTVPIIKL